MLLAACDRSRPVTIGVVGPWQTSFGAMNRRGVELAVEQINARGGIKGDSLRVLMRDDSASGSSAATIAQEFVKNADVVAVVGHVNSAAMLAAAPVYDGDVAAVATSVTSPDLSGISPGRWIFRVTSSDSANGAEMAGFAARTGHRRVAILYENDAYGRGLIGAFRDAFKRAGTGTILGADPISGDMRTPQAFEPYVARLKQQAPDLVLVAGTEQTGVPFLREARRQGLAADFLGGDGWTAVAGDTTVSEGIYVAVPFTPTDPRPEVQQFVRDFRARFNATPDGLAALAYDATMVVAQAVRERGADRAGVRDYLALLSESTAYRGVTGPIHFQSTGDPIGKGFVVARVRGGTFVLDSGGGR